MPRREARAPTICVVLDRLPRPSSGVDEEQADIDVEASRSAKAEAITFWPRSCPSCPILATRMRGRRPSASSEVLAHRLDARDGWVHLADLPLVDPEDRLDLGGGARDLLHRQRDLADRRLGPRGLDREVEPDAVASRAVGERSARPAPRSRRARQQQERLSLHRAAALRHALLSTFSTSIAASFSGEHVDADDRLLAGVDAPASWRRPRCATSECTGFDRLGHAAEFLDLLDMAPRPPPPAPPSAARRNRAAPGVDGPRRAALLLEPGSHQVLRACGRRIGRQRQRFVRGVGVQRRRCGPASPPSLSIIVRGTLLNTSCAVGDQPEVWL